MKFVLMNMCKENTSCKMYWPLDTGKEKRLKKRILQVGNFFHKNATEWSQHKFTSPNNQKINWKLEHFKFAYIILFTKSSEIIVINWILVLWLLENEQQIFSTAKEVSSLKFSQDVVIIQHSTPTFTSKK